MRACGLSPLSDHPRPRYPRQPPPRVRTPTTPTGPHRAPTGSGAVAADRHLRLSVGSLPRGPRRDSSVRRHHAQSLRRALRNRFRMGRPAGRPDRSGAGGEAGHVDRRADDRVLRAAPTAVGDRGAGIDRSDRQRGRVPGRVDGDGASLSPRATCCRSGPGERGEPVRGGVGGVCGCTRVCLTRTGTDVRRCGAGHGHDRGGSRLDVEGHAAHAADGSPFVRCTVTCPTVSPSAP